jgi:hypothetical protein
MATHGHLWPPLYSQVAHCYALVKTSTRGTAQGLPAAFPGRLNQLKTGRPYWGSGSKSFGDAIDSLADLERLSLGLLEPLLPTRKGVRLLGISLSSLTEAQATGRQLSLVLQ